MPYYGISDDASDDRRTMRAGVAAFGLYALAGSWCCRHLTDGFVPDYAAAKLDPDYEQHAQALVSAGYWVHAHQDGDKGWQFADWDNQPTRASTEAKRAAWRVRTARSRERHGVTPDVTNDVTHGPVTESHSPSHSHSQALSGRAGRKARGAALPVDKSRACPLHAGQSVDNCAPCASERKAITDEHGFEYDAPIVDAS